MAVGVEGEEVEEGAELAELAELSAAVDAVAAVDPAVVGDDGLTVLIIGLQRERARLGVVAAGLLGAWDGRRVWAADGSKSAGARLARETNSSKASADGEITRARRLRGLPVTAPAVLDGTLSLDHVDLLGHANSGGRERLFTEREAFLVEQCRSLRYPQAARAVSYWCRHADDEVADPTVAVAPAEPSSALYVSRTLDGTVAVSGGLEPVDGAVVVTELDRLEHDLYLVDRAGGVDRSPAQRRAAAWVEMATRSATAPVGGRRPRPLFTVLVGDRSLTGVCELVDGTVITPRSLVRWADTAVLETVLFDGPSTVVSVSHRRSFTGALRRAVEVRDRHCQHPAGCDMPADRCDVDHIVPVSQGGETSQWNAQLECQPHNRDASLHDHHTPPHPSRPLTRLDHYRARIRWQLQHTSQDDEDDSDDDGGPLYDTG